MPFTFTMPKLSPTMEEGVIAKWHKKEGDLVKSGEVIIEVATDKATVEHAALDGGYLRKILVNEGQGAVVNQAIAIMSETKDESIEGYKVEGVQAAKKEEAKVSAPPTEKTESKEAPAPKGGAMQQPAFVPAPPLSSYKYEKKSADQRILASPLAKKLAKQKGIDIATIKGSGPNRRVMSRDIDLGQPDLLVAFDREEAPELPSGTYEELPLSPMRKIISQRLQESKTFIPHFYVTQEMNVDSLSDTREQLKSLGIKISINDFLVKAVALALRQHPEMNSGFNTVNSTILRFKTIDISVAVSTESGLITPILRYADYKNLGELSVEMKLLAQKARNGRLSREEYIGGSFTISNLGMFGITQFSGIINPPQANILAVGGIIEKPIVKNGQVVVGKTMQLTLSSDHRVVDGADSARFLQTLQELIENPAILVI